MTWLDQEDASYTEGAWARADGCWGTAEHEGQALDLAGAKAQAEHWLHLERLLAALTAYETGLGPLAPVLEAADALR